MALEKFGEKLREGIANIAKKVLLKDSDIEEFCREIQRTLIQADVEVSLVFELTKKIKTKAMKEDIPAGLTKKEHVIKIVYDEITNLLGNEKSSLILSKKPAKIMLLGLFGSGKTTTTGKLGYYFKRKGEKCLVVETDTWRPAAFEQLSQLAGKVNIDFFGIKNEKNPEKIIKKAEELFPKYDIIIVDTAGRDALDNELSKEIKKIAEVLIPDEVLLVISGDIGQQAREQAEKFKELVGTTGVIITKLDSTAKGGGAISACSATETKVKFIGTGEKTDELEEYEPKRFVSRLLGMGDIERLLEKAKSAIKEEDMEDMEKRFMEGKLTFLDLYTQMESIKKMGPLNKVMSMIPGLSAMNIPKEFMEQGEKSLDEFKVIMNSMTFEELQNPKIMSSSRIERIAKGAGVSEEKVREIIKKHAEMQKMTKMLKGRNLKNLMKNFKGMKGLM